MERIEVPHLTVAENIRRVLDADHIDVKLVEVTFDGFLKVRITGAVGISHSAKKMILNMFARVFRDVVCSNIKGVILVSQMSRK